MVMLHKFVNLNLNRHFSQSARRRVQFTKQHDNLKDTVKKIVAKHVNPYEEQWEKEGMFDGHYVFKKFGEAGLLGISRDPKYNGLGLDYSYSVAFFEALGSSVFTGGVVSGLLVQTDMATPALAKFGSDHLKQQFLAPSIAGDYVACLGVTEPSCGSDVAAIKTTASKSGDDLIINGEKMWITNGYQADWICLLANTNQGPPHKNKSLICVPMDLPGVRRARKLEKMGHKCSDTAHLFFENVRVPQKNIIGEEGMGFTYQMLQFQDERICVASTVHSTAQKVLDATIEYCRQRHTFGQPLINNQYIHFKLAELQCDIEIYKAFTYYCIDKIIEGEDITYLASIAKYKGARLSRTVTDNCLQFYGGMGYSDELPISRAFRDSRALSIAGGADEIMLSIICKFMDILPKKKSK